MNSTILSPNKLVSSLQAVCTICPRRIAAFFCHARESNDSDQPLAGKFDDAFWVCTGSSR